MPEAKRNHPPHQAFFDKAHNAGKEAEDMSEEYMNGVPGENELVSLLDTKQYSRLRKVLADMNEADIAAIMDNMEDSDSLRIFRILPKDKAADVFPLLEVDDQKYIIMSLSNKEASNIIDNLMADDATDLLEEMPANVVKRILRNASPDTRKDINHLLQYPEDSAGSVMTVEFVDLRENMKVQDAIDRIRHIGLDSETVNVCYVLDSKRVLRGTVALRYLLIMPPDAVIGKIMNDNVISVRTTADQEEAAEKMQKYNFTVLPVVDKENRMVGIITVDDVVDIMQEETTEDIEKMAAILPSDKSYLKTGVFETYRNRIPWLLVLMIVSMFTGLLITRYRNILMTYIVLTSYIPMLMDTGGNAGSQASVSVIRGLSIHEIKFKDLFHVIWKEIRVAALCGATLAAVNLVKLILFDRVSAAAALTLCLTLVLVVIISKTIGVLLPLVTEKLGFDPAAVASPLLTTIVDAVSLCIYFAAASALL